MCTVCGVCASCVWWPCLERRPISCHPTRHKHARSTWQPWRATLSHPRCALSHPHPPTHTPPQFDAACFTGTYVAGDVNDEYLAALENSGRGANRRSGVSRVELTGAGAPAA